MGWPVPTSGWQKPGQLLTKFAQGGDCPAGTDGMPSYEQVSEEQFRTPCLAIPSILLIFLIAQQLPAIMTWHSGHSFAAEEFRAWLEVLLCFLMWLTSSALATCHEPTVQMLSFQIQLLAGMSSNAGPGHHLTNSCTIFAVIGHAMHRI